jgi:hypothetical protein
LNKYESVVLFCIVLVQFRHDPIEMSARAYMGSRVFNVFVKTSGHCDSERIRSTACFSLRRDRSADFSSSSGMPARRMIEVRRACAYWR